jgi:hypothetical protein
MKCQQDKNGKNTGYDCKCIDTSKNNNVCTHDWQCNDRDLSACPTESGEMDPSAGTYSGCKSPDGTIVGDIEGRCIVARSGQSLPQMTKYTCPNSSSINSAGCQKNEQIVPAGASSVCFESNFCGVQQIDAVGSYANCFMEVLDTASCSTTPPTSQPSIPTPTEIPAAPYCAAVEAFSSTGTALSSSDLSALTVGAVVNFCVRGIAPSGSFDSAQFTIDGTQLAETTTRNSRGDFCQSYTILSTDTTVTVTAKIHHSTLGWF